MELSLCGFVNVGKCIETLMHIDQRHLVISGFRHVDSPLLPWKTGTFFGVLRVLALGTRSCTAGAE